ncbi:MAG: hypothetical protein ABFS56_05965 [Pseudomonadota bacterium]
MKIQRYKFFDQTVELRSDHADTLTLMDVMFRRFAVRDNDGETVRYEVLTDVGGRAGIITKDYCYIIEDPTRLPSLAHGIILRNTLARIRSHLLFHAAALSYRGKGVILAADSGCGKTTLTLALVRQGFKFLSDEAAALGLNNGELTPYPRSLLVRMGTLKVFQQRGWELPSHQTALKTDDRMAIHFSSALLGDKCQPHCLIIVQRPDKADDRICKVTLDSMPARLWANLQGIVIQDFKKSEGFFPVFKAKEADVNKIYEACEQLGVLVLDVEESAVAPSYFENTPQLQEISKLTAAISLLQYFLGSHRSVLLQEDFQGSVAGLIQPLVKILAPVKCYQLTPGRLEQTVESINRVVSK